MIEEWLNSELEMKALYYGSLEVKIDHDKKEAEEFKAKQNSGNSRGRRR